MEVTKLEELGSYFVYSSNNVIPEGYLRSARLSCSKFSESQPAAGRRSCETSARGREVERERDRERERERERERKTP